MNNEILERVRREQGREWGRKVGE